MEKVFFNIILGTDVEDSLFELQSIPLARSLEGDISTLLKNFEPRIRVKSVKVSYPDYSNELNITMSYDIIGLPIPTQTVDFILQPTRV